MNRFWLVMLGVCLAAGSVGAAPGDEHAFELTWREDGFWKTVSCPMGQTKPFASEPDFEGREIVRGTFEVGSADQREEVGFVWDYSKGQMYVDLNRDGDLTNDPNGIVESPDDREGTYISQSFEPFPFEMTTSEGVYPYRISANLTRYRSQHAYGQVNIQSGYEGDVELGEQRWRFRIADLLRGRIQENEQLDVWPVEKGGANRIDSVPKAKRLFLDGRCYELEFAFDLSGGGRPVLRGLLREQEVPMAALRIEGERISRLVFGNQDMLILPELEAGEEGRPVPAGEFTCRSLTLKAGDLQASPARVEDLWMKAEPGETAVFRAGAPLESRVTVKRMGGVLQFGFELVGIGGESYDASNVLSYEKRPSVSIYKGDLLLSSGQFEFG